ncbi:restriction endonuclease subunit S [Agrococcus sp. KRD186]|uniref:restriction endonuclease subunit S n=1 Tax=Agrococcus sp. KRD186 TaxID=2729730 RepID=UPI0019D18F3F|nr:restriction endonuclease subunit S [Agrococcus sp. KRD186]
MIAAEAVPIGDVLQRRQDAVRVEADETYVMVGVLNKGRGLFTRGNVSGSDTNYERLTRLRHGDLIFSKLFAWEGSVAVVDRAGWVSSEFPTYAIDATRVDPAYLSHVIGWEGFVGQLAKATSGLGQRRQRVAPERFESAIIPLPDLESQRAIATRLDRIARARRTASSQHLSTIRSRLLLDSLAGAREQRVDTLLERRRQPIEVSETQSYKMLGMRNRGRGAFDAGVLHGSETKYPRLLRVLAGDLIYLKLGAWEGAFGIVPPELDGRHTSPEFVSYDVDEDQIDRDFLEAMVTWDGFAFRVGGLSKGTNLRRRRLNPDVFESLSIPLPTLERQRELGPTLLQLRRAGAQIARRDELTHALLPAARNEEFGKLLVR